MYDISFEFDRNDRAEEISLTAALLFEKARALENATGLVDSVPVDTFMPLCSRIHRLSAEVTELECQLEAMT